MAHAATEASLCEAPSEFAYAFTFVEAEVFFAFVM